MTRSEVTAAIVAARLLPVLRVADAHEAQASTERVIEAGLRVVELTATTRGWEAAVRAVRDDWPGAVLGVGTLRSGEDAKRAVDAGADFLVTPWPAPDVRVVADAEGALLVDGGFTPAEVAAAVGVGSDLVAGGDVAARVRAALEAVA